MSLRLRPNFREALDRDTRKAPVHRAVGNRTGYGVQSQSYWLLPDHVGKGNELITADLESLIASGEREHRQQDNRITHTDLPWLVESKVYPRARKCSSSLLHCERLAPAGRNQLGAFYS